jgi:hypothetical protein
MSEQAKLIPNLLLILFAALQGYLSKLRLASILFNSKTRKNCSDSLATIAARIFCRSGRPIRYNADKR